jgi:tRNA(Arg) A34 adenosine deaminase TadA
MCISALSWAGFKDIYYFFGYEQTQDDFNIPHDLRMLREVFGCATPTKENIYYRSRSLMDIAEGLEDLVTARVRIARIKETYAGLSAVYQAGEKKMVLK